MDTISRPSPNLGSYRNIVAMGVGSLAISLPFFTYSFRIVGIGFSLDRILMLLLAPAVLLYVWEQRKQSSGALVCYFFIAFGFVLANLTHSPDTNGVGLPALYSYLILFVFCFSPISDERLDKYVLISFLVYLTFVVYSIHHFLSTGTNLVYKPFHQYMPFLDSAIMPKAEKMGLGFNALPRMQFPFATPPHLSVVSGIYALYFLSRLRKKTSAVALNYFLIIGALTCMFVTQSRSGALAFAIGMFVYLGLVNGTRNSLCFIALAIVTVILLFGRSELFITITEILDRLTKISSISDVSAHYFARKEGFDFFLNMSAHEKLWGIGLGEYFQLHTHMSYLTVMIERGVIGLFIFAFPICFVFSKFWFLIQPSRAGIFLVKEEYASQFAIVILIFISHLFYEFTYVMPLYMFLGIALKKFSNNGSG